MGQFDSASSAALERMKSEIGPPASPALKLADRLTGLAGNLAEAIGLKGATVTQDLLRDLMDVAPRKDEANLLYFAEWVSLSKAKSSANA